MSGFFILGPSETQPPEKFTIAGEIVNRGLGVLYGSGYDFLSRCQMMFFGVLAKCAVDRFRVWKQLM